MRTRSIPGAPSRRRGPSPWRGALLGAAGTVLLSLGGGACASLPDVPTNTCGNGIVEPGEECDTFAPSGARCRSEDEVFACRFDCAKSADGKQSSCPSGFVCGGADGICQKPTGKFGDGAVSFEASAGKMVLGDFDGDGRKDVVAVSKPDIVQQSSARVFYFDGLSSPRSLSLPTVGFSPSVADVDGDGLDDLVLGNYVGINVFLGAADRTLEPQAFGRFPFPPNSKLAAVIVHGVKDPKLAPFGEAAVLFVDTVISGKPAKIVTLGSASADPGEKVFAVLGKGPTDLVGAPIVGNFIESSPCQEIVYGWKGEGELQILSLCEADGSFRKTPELTPKKALALPSGATALGIVAADLNGDGHQDLVVGGAEGSAIAFGRGDGTFSARPDLSPGTEAAKLRCEAFDGQPCPLPLAIDVEASKKFGGPIVALGKSAAFPAAILRATSLTTSGSDIMLGGTVLGLKLSGDWTSVVIADFNGNGIPDVAAASSAGLDVDFYNGTPSGNFNPSKIPTDFPVSKLEVGDFDGDLVNDLALVEVGAGANDQDEVTVAFGRPAGAPEDPLPMGSFPGIKGILSGKFDAKDEMSEIGVLFQLNGDQISALDGDGNRQLLSPFGLSGADSAKAALAGMPGALAVGKFSTTSKLPGVGVVAGQLNDDLEKGLATVRLWFAPFQTETPRLSTAGVSDVVSGVSAFNGLGVSIHSAAGDLDGDGVDELVTVMSSSVKDGTSVVLGKMGKPKFAPEGTPSETLLPGTPVKIDGGASGPLSDLALVDLDGDGKKDGIAFLDQRPSGKLIVFWNDGSLGVTTVLEPPAGKWRGFAVLDYKGALPTTIVGVTDKGVYWFSAGANKRALTANAIDNVAGGQAVAAGDVSGDGIPDLLVANGGRVTVYPGLARKP